ncbi:MAG TPA: acetylglutamate kinase [Firmicutes bacterium]|nr:acetylglutamate kinase [Bacillota bacterium]
MDVLEKAEVLIEALPYIRTFYGKTFVIKYGGNAMLNDELKKAVMLDVILLKYVGVDPVLVHGGGPEIDHMMQKMGKKPHFVDGLRVTDRETMEIVQMVLVGKLNLEIVSLINKYGGRAVGLSGKDGNLILARKHLHRPAMLNSDPAAADLGFVGDVEKINPEMIHTLNQEGYIPVISSIGVGLDGESYNINADTVAGELAAALKAEKLIMLTDVDGIRESQAAGAERISALKVERAREMISRGDIAGGMIPKVEACIRALESGVTRTHILDGRKMHSLLLEIFTDEGIGTMVIS